MWLFEMYLSTFYTTQQVFSLALTRNLQSTFCYNWRLGNGELSNMVIRLVSFTSCVQSLNSHPTKKTDLYFIEQLQQSYINVDWFSYEVSVSFVQFSPKKERVDVSMIISNTKFHKNLSVVLCSFLRTEAPKNSLKMFFFYFCSCCAKGPQKIRKKMAYKIVREEIYNWGLYIFIYNTFSLYGHSSGGVIMEKSFC